MRSPFLYVNDSLKNYNNVVGLLIIIMFDTKKYNITIQNFGGLYV